MTRTEAERFRAHLDAVITGLPDETALEVKDLFLFWSPGITYNIGDRRQYAGDLYRCEQLHVAQSDWTPDISPALWTKISVEEWPEWVQPTGAQDAYRIGDKVTYNGKHWICTIDYCVYAPIVAGWEEVN